MAAPSAGCLVVDQGEVLLVKIMEGTLRTSGGSVDDANQHNARQARDLRRDRRHRACRRVGKEI